MCRHLAWLGEPRSLAELMLRPRHGLLTQSYAPRRQKHGSMNADGWGAGFFDGTVPRRWRSAMPLWGHASFASVAPALRSTCVVAAVRSATVGMPIEESATAPFTDGEWLLSHNGVVRTSTLPLVTGHESSCDSAILASLLFSQGLDDLGTVIEQAGAADPNARLNILAANRTRILATTWGDTLSVLECDDGVVVTSEPYDDDPAWQDIPDHHLVEVIDGRVSLTPLKGAR